jgi:uncharacterized protein (TIGR02271 family)
MAQDTSTITAVFDDYGTAESAARELENIGVPRESIDVRSNFKTGAAGRSEYADDSQQGGISGFFHRLFGGHEDSDHYSEAVRRGSTVVAVTAPNSQLDQAVEILNSRGAVDIDRRVEEYRKTGYERHNPEATPYSHDEAVRERGNYRDMSSDGGSIPVVEEELQVGKRAVQRGGVRIYSRVVEKPVDQNVELREEHVRVERRPVDRPAQVGDADRFREQSVEVTEMAEEPVIRKLARVREEVVVDKETTVRTENVKDKVRKTEVQVEKLAPGATTGTGDYRDDFRRDYEANYANTGEPYDTMQPAYEYGYASANDARYRGRDWADTEEELRTDYLRRNPNSSWDRMKGAVRYGWEKVTGKRG